MKTGYLTLIFALACAACTPRFYPPKVDVPDGYLYGEGFPRDPAALASDWWRLFGDTVRVEADPRGWQRELWATAPYVQPGT